MSATADSSPAEDNKIVARYEKAAAEYARYWAPVLENTARRVIDFADEIVARRGGDVRVVEIGVGTGTLLLAALCRWPKAQLVATDAASGMLAAARRRVVAEMPEEIDRVEFHRAMAHELPVADESADLVISSFVLQLVPDRHEALQEARRVLRPGGSIAYVTWLDRDSREPFLAADEFDEAVLDLGVPEPGDDDGARAGDVRSARTAANELRRAGFTRASTREDELVYAWTMKSYLDYKFKYDERFLLSLLKKDQRRELERNVRERMMRLLPSDFTWHAPVVFARATRP